MIRARLRLLGRLLYNIKKVNPTVTDFASIYSPEIYDDFIAAVNILAEVSADGTKYKRPAVASNIGTLVKYIGRILISECIKKKDDEKKKDVAQFLELLQEDYGTSVNKTVAESQSEYARQKVVTLPTMQDIKKLNQYIKTNRENAYDTLIKSYSFEAWGNLAAFTLIGLQLFNRRRPGELERALISDFEAYQTADDDVNADIQKHLNDNERKAAMLYRRFCIRGKLNRIVSVLMNNHEFKCLKLIIEYRSQAGVSSENPYIFGLPNGTQQFLSACQLMRRLSVACGAKNPDRLRGTELRKHLATKSAVNNADNGEVAELADFLGHAESIHRQHYRISLPTRQIVKTSKVLEDDLDDSFSDKGNETTLSRRSLSRRDDTLSEDNTYDSDALSNCSESPSVIKRMKSGRSGTKRISWSDPERSVAEEVFACNLENGTLPSLMYCASTISLHPELKRRTPEQLKAWVNNQIIR